VVRRYAAAERRVEWGALAAAALALIAMVFLRTPLHGRAYDSLVQHALNAMMNRLPAIGFQTAILNQDLFLLVIAAGSLALWFRRPVQRRFRTRILIAICAFLPAYALARIGQHFDNHVRPIVDQSLLPLGDPNFQIVRAELAHWGSFPSGHAALLAIVTFVAYLVGRRTGFVVLCLSVYSRIFRIAYGYHWPSDIAGGAFLGIVIVLVLFHWHRFLAPVLAGIFAFIDKRPGIAAVIGTISVCEFSNGFRYSQFFVQLALHTHLFH
jgi:undecaprenyl-diphosphatase